MIIMWFYLIVFDGQVIEQDFLTAAFKYFPNV